MLYLKGERQVEVNPGAEGRVNQEAKHQRPLRPHTHCCRLDQSKQCCNWARCTALSFLGYLDSGEGLNDPDEVLFQQVVVQRGQVRVDDWVVPQFCSVLCEGLQQTQPSTQ